jgi:hypothetical protein
MYVYYKLQYFDLFQGLSSEAMVGSTARGKRLPFEFLHSIITTYMEELKIDTAKN